MVLASIEKEGDRFKDFHAIPIAAITKVELAEWKEIKLEELLEVRDQFEKTRNILEKYECKLIDSTDFENDKYHASMLVSALVKAPSATNHILACVNDSIEREIKDIIPLQKKEMRFDYT